jgi:hypothetical protein
MHAKIKNGLPFTFTDFHWTNKWDKYTSIGVNKIENLREIMYIF